MKILVNAVSVKEGGSYVVLTRLAREMRRLGGNAFDMATITNPRLLAGQDAAELGRTHVFPWAETTPLHLAYFYDVVFPALVAREKPDVVFSETNYLPARRLAAPTLLLVQHAGFFSPEYMTLQKRHAPGLAVQLGWYGKRRRVLGSIRRATRVTVQTAALAGAIRDSTGRPRSDIAVIPHGPGAVAHVDGPKPYRRPSAQRPFRIGCLTTPGVQKNFETVLDAVAELRDEGRPVQLVATFGSNGADRASIDARIRALGLDRLIEDHLEAPFSGMTTLYDSLDLFVFPSVCESFGFPMVEAMARGLPVIVAGTASNREVTGGGAADVAPYDSAAFAAAIQAIMDDAETYRAAALRALERASKFSWERAARKTLAALETLATSGRADA